jgi:hypothetical protein
MKSLTCIIFFLITVSFDSSAQTSPVKNRECDFLGPLHYKNDKAIVAIKAKFDGCFRSGVSDVFRRLEKQKKLRRKDYPYNIGFYPENCSTRYGAAIKYKGPINLFKLPISTKVFLTLAVYRQANNTAPFFVVNNVLVIKQ